MNKIIGTILIVLIISIYYQLIKVSISTEKRTKEIEEQLKYYKEVK